MGNWHFNFFLQFNLQATEKEYPIDFGEIGLSSFMVGKPLILNSGNPKQINVILYPISTEYFQGQCFLPGVVIQLDSLALPFKIFELLTLFLYMVVEIDKDILQIFIQRFIEDLVCV